MLLKIERPCPWPFLQALQHSALAQPGSSNLGITDVLLLQRVPLAWHAG